MTDWDKELAKIDKQLASMSDDELGATAPVRPALSPPTKGGGKPARASTPEVPDAAAPVSGMAKFALYARFSLAVALGVGMIFWPYDAKCGAGLGLYLGAVAALIVSGGWASIWTWRHRAARLHTLSLLILTWGLILGGLDVLPKVGYAKPTILHPANWACK